MVFRLGDDDLIARFQRETLGGLSPASKRRVAECGGQQVQSCGGTGGDDDLLFAFRRIGANQLGHFGARILERMVLRAASSCAPRCTPALMVR